VGDQQPELAHGLRPKGIRNLFHENGNYCRLK